ncbi:MAG: hypothetical protein ABIF77_00215 [bacterium]
MRKSLILITCMLVACLATSLCFGNDQKVEPETTKAQAEQETATVLTVEMMADQVKELDGVEFCVEATIIGACKSGCKMWIADGEYEEGQLFSLVRAKDDAFKFDTDKSGTRVRLTGYVLAKFKDYCGDAAAAGKAEPKEGEQAGSCKAPVKVETATEGDLQEMTFFATKVDYLGES